MKIVVFGLAISSSWGNGHATLWRGLVRALSVLGHRVVFFERDVPYYAAHRDFPGAPELELVLYPDWDAVSGTARFHLAEADAAIVTSFCPDSIAATRQIMDSPVRAKIFYDMDTPVTLKSLESGKSPAYIGPEGLKDFDLVLSFTGGRALSALRDRLGARRVAALYGSVDPEVHKPARPTNRYRSDLSFLGTYSADRHEALCRFLVDPARRLPHKLFRIAGAQYPGHFPWTTNLFYIQHVPPPDHAAFYSASQWSLNLTRGTMAEMGFCPSGRLFEAAACGSPILTDEWEGLEQFFRPPLEIVKVRTTEDVVAALSMGPQQRQEIARAARKRALENHTAQQRAAELETLLHQVTMARPPAASDRHGAL